MIGGKHYYKFVRVKYFSTIRNFCVHREVFQDRVIRNISTRDVRDGFENETSTRGSLPLP